MCLLAIQYRSVPEAPILVAANREEAYDRPSLVPAIQPGKPRVLSGVDARHGGTWLGVNQNGLFVGACNRPKMMATMGPRSRGLLCKELLRVNSARQAVDLAMEELLSGKYEGVNFVIADNESGWVVHGNEDPEVEELEEGLNIISSYDVNDPRDERQKLARRLLTLQTLDSAVKFLAVASKAFARPPATPDRPGMVVQGKERGTVSSTLIALGKKPRDAIFQYAAGAPDTARYEDYSPLLRDILSRGLRESRTRAKA
ncbi:NRDE family protein [Anatilimnocola sp. NA78]|uniref:NRDE family protein n=1 Tax=Anatilimnocola sp. NA78 TaxID=3415683 RepID=UPI003CE4946D